MRIAHVITRFIPGGADENTLLTCNAQARSAHQVTLIAGREWNPVFRRKLDPSIRFVVLPALQRQLTPVEDLIALVQLTTLLRRLQPDIVHTHTSKAGIVGRMAAKLANVPTIVHGVHILAFRNVPLLLEWGYVAVERLCGRFTNLFIHVSRDMQEECKRRHIGSEALHVIAQSGMDVERFHDPPSPRDADELTYSPIDSDEHPFVILSLAALDKRKRLHLFLPIFERIIERRPNTVLLLAGSGPEFQDLEQQVEELSLTDHVRFLGHRGDPECLLALADTLIVCSEREGLPRTAVQAAIAGVPIVTTALPGIEEIVDHGRTGYVVPLNDLAPMEEILVKLIDDPAARYRFRQALRNIDVSSWNTETMVSRISEAYELVIEYNRRSREFLPAIEALKQ